MTGGTAVLMSCMLTCVVLASACLGEPIYQITGLGTLGGQYSRACSINNRSQIVGASTLHSPSTEHAFLWQDGVMTDLGTPLGGTRSAANSINDQGQIAGDWMISMDYRTFIYNNGTMTDTGNFGGDLCSFSAINESGQVAGYIDGPSGKSAFLWENGQVTLIGTLNSTGDKLSVGLDINNNGQVVGFSTTDIDAFHAFLWQNSHMRDLGLTSWNCHINDSGQIAGATHFPDNGTRAVLWQNGITTDICSLGIRSSAGNINNLGQVVGMWQTADGYYDTEGNWMAEPVGRAFIWKSGTAIDLNSLIPDDSGWVLESAVDINDQGQIIGQGWLNGQYGPYLLTPVPEPSSLAALTLGLIPLATAGIRSRRRG
ncbi:MAG: PEP-CTERM sorting domain-containing protein [Armatimonadota bacterium]